MSETSKPTSMLVLDVTLYESEDPPWAEWEMWREFKDMRTPSEWVGRGTAPSLEAAVDKAIVAWHEGQS